jgi:hypothetical protein
MSSVVSHFSIAVEALVFLALRRRPVRAQWYRWGNRLDSIVGMQLNDAWTMRRREKNDVQGTATEKNVRDG